MFLELVRFVCGVREVSERLKGLNLCGWWHFIHEIYEV